MAGRPKERVFRSSLKSFWLLCGIAAPFALFLIYMGTQGLRYFPPEAEDPFRILAGYVPLAVAGCCILGLGFIFMKNARRGILVHPLYLVYKAPGREVQFRWEDVLFTPPRPDQKPLFPTAMVSDGTTFVRFEKFFFPEFEEICRIIADTKRAVRGEELVI